jgi:hypothetical protein
MAKGKPFKEVKKRFLSDPEFKKEYDDLEDEFKDKEREIERYSGKSKMGASTCVINDGAGI